MIGSRTKAHFLASITLGRSSVNCCHSIAPRMPRAFGADHTAGQPDKSPFGRSEHHEQTGY
jgi:hypothetical protein